MGHLTDPDNDITMIEYDILGRRTKKMLPNGCYTTYTYDPVGNRKTMNITSPKNALPFHEYAPTLDHQPKLKHPIRVEYTYNSIDQLLTETGYRTNKPRKQYYKTDYTYDPNGNIILKSLLRGDEEDGDNDDDEGGTFNTSYDYDYQNLLKKITYPDTTTNTFINCRCGSFRHQKVDSQGLTNYLYDKYNDSPILETDETYKPKVRYVKGPRIDELISRTVYEYEDDDEDDNDEEGEVEVETKTYYYLQDGLGNVRQLVDEKGKVASEYDYLPFGEIIESKHGESKKNPFTYTGKPYDQDSGLNYNQARYNDSRIGRFTTQDPLLRQPRAPVIFEHPYVYVRNNPMQFIDPFGFASYVSGTFTMPGWSPHPRTGTPTWLDTVKLQTAYAQAPFIWLASPPANSFHYHYLLGGGTPRTVNFGEVIEDESGHALESDIVRDVTDAMRFADTLTSSGRIRSENWQTESSAVTRKWYWAMGTIPWSGDGEVKVCGCMELKLKYYAHDPYDFDYTDNPVGLLRDRDYRRFHDVGLADEFLITGESAIITIRWPKGSPGTVSASQINFESGSTITFP